METIRQKYDRRNAVLEASQDYQEALAAWHLESCRPVYGTQGGRTRGELRAWEHLQAVKVQVFNESDGGFVLLTRNEQKILQKIRRNV